MASLMMHYAISKLIADEIHIGNFNRFALGAMAPDIPRKEHGSKQVSHFTQITDEKKGINYQWFIEKYFNNTMLNDFYLGYFTHLIVDSVWLATMYTKNIRRDDYLLKQDDVKKGYNDMRQHNPRLIERFGLEFNFVNDSVDMDEIDVSQMDWLLETFHKHFNHELDARYAFEIYKPDEVLYFINIATNRCIDEINAIRNGTAIGNPEDFFIQNVK